MELLDSTRNADLLYALYGLLMFLPQCQAFHCLKDRLACLPPENVMKLNRYAINSNTSEIYTRKGKEVKQCIHSVYDVQSISDSSAHQK